MLTAENACLLGLNSSTIPFFQFYLDRASCFSIIKPQLPNYSALGHLELCLRFFSKFSFKANDPSSQNYLLNTVHSFFQKDYLRPITLAGSLYYKMLGYLVRQLPLLMRPSFLAPNGERSIICLGGTDSCRWF